MDKIIFSGLESSGKSYQLAVHCSKIVYRNSKWFKQTGKERPIWSNLRFSEEFRQFASDNNVPIHYWKDLDDLIKVQHADVIIDEVGNYFDSRGWQDLSLDVRRWLTQGAKSGIEMYGTAQDFAQVDKAFRRLIDPGDLYFIRKLVGSRRPSSTKPPVKRIWGLCIMVQLDPAGYDEDKKKYASIIPKFFTLERRYCEIFDTEQKIEKSLPPLMKHVERFCEDKYCKAIGHHKIQHI